MTTVPDTPTPIPRDRHAGRTALLLLAGIVVLVGMRRHGFDLPLETDECNYAYIGARLLEGDRLYVDVWDHQPFGVFALFASVIAVFGDEPEVFRWMAVVFSAGSLLLLFGLIRTTGGMYAATLGTALFAFVSSDPGTGGEGCNRELYMSTLVLAAWYLTVATPLRRRGSLLLAGLLLALGSAVKTIVAVHWLALAVWIVACPPCDRRNSRRWIDLTLVALGPLLLWLLTTAYFAATDRFGDFVDAVFLFNLGYSESDQGALGRFAQFFTPKRHPFIFDSALPLWLTGAAGTLWLVVRTCSRRRGEPDRARSGIVTRRAAAAIALLVAASFVAVCLPGRFWPHYYYLLIPPMVVAASLGAGALARWGSRIAAGALGGRHTSRAVHAILFVALLGAVFWTEYSNYLVQDPLGITIKRYNSRDFWGAGQGHNVRSVTDPEDRIFVFSNDASIYYYSGRRCASRYTMITGISGDMPSASERRDVLMHELRAHPPRLILVLFDEEPFPAWQFFLREHYGEPIGWDFHDKTSEPIMFVLCLKDQPVREIDWNWDRSMIAPSDRP